MRRARSPDADDAHDLNLLHGDDDDEMEDDEEQANEHTPAPVLFEQFMALAPHARGTFVSDHPSLLVDAVRHRELGVVKALLETQEGRDIVNVSSAEGQVWSQQLLPLWIAVLHGSIGLMELLLRANADPWLCDAHGRQLDWCVHYGEIAIFSHRGTARVQRMHPLCTSTGTLSPIVAMLSDAKKHWTPDSHLRFPDQFRARVFMLLLCNARLGQGGGMAQRLSRDVLHKVIALMAAEEGQFRRDRICKEVFEEATIRHLIVMHFERGLGYCSQRTGYSWPEYLSFSLTLCRRAKMEARLHEYAKEHGVD